jgi:hypothetical protein
VDLFYNYQMNPNNTPTLDVEVPGGGVAGTGSTATPSAASVFGATSTELIYNWTLTPQPASETLTFTSWGSINGGSGWFPTVGNQPPYDFNQPPYRLQQIEVGSICVPEPSTFALLGLGTVGLLSCQWRRRMAKV